MSTISLQTPAAAGTSLRSALASVLATDRSAVQLVLRLALGLVILPHGLQKTFGWFGGYGFDATLGYFAGIGIPAALGALAIAAESLGAAALLAGLTTRIAAFGIGVTMVVASLFHRANGFFMNWSGAQKGEGVEFHILAIALAIALVIGGAGRASVDRVLAKKLR